MSTLPTGATPGLLRLPEELLDAVVQHLSPNETVALGRTCKQAAKPTKSPLVWRRHCLETWNGWHRRHGFEEKLLLPAMQTDWQELFNSRRNIDRAVLYSFNQMLRTQRYKYQRIEDIASYGLDAIDILEKLQTNTPDSDDYVLAQRYYASVILGQIRRKRALDTWIRLGQGQSMRIDEALGAYDLFVFPEYNLGIDRLSNRLDRLAQRVRGIRQDFDSLCVREKSVLIASVLRAEGVLGISGQQEYHALQNNFLSTAFRAHSSLPLQSVALYCAVAQRLGVSANPSNFPQHVHAVIEAASDRTLDGDICDPEALSSTPKEYMYMDPWRSSEEVPVEHLRLRLSQMGLPADVHENYLGPASVLEMTLRTGRNIMVSVEEARHRPTRDSIDPELEVAWYAMLWAMVVLGDSEDRTAFTRRRQFIPYLVQHFQSHSPEDIPLMELIPTLLEQQRDRQVLTDMLEASRIEDTSARSAKRRDESTKDVMYKVGHHFSHKRMGYHGFIIGWDPECAATDSWISQMRVDELPQGRSQPFYNIICEDKSVRYVAQENILLQYEQPSDILMDLAGRYFKRWEDTEHKFGSNILDDYPDD